MKASAQNLARGRSGVMNWILGGLTFVTLYFQPALADPFNSPKLWILLITSAWLLGHVFSCRKLILLSLPLRQLSFFLLFFLISLLAATLMTDYKYVAFFGETQRRNGFFQYASLAIICVASAMFVRSYNVKKFYSIAFFVAVASFTYSLMQTTGNDFVSWNNPYNSVISTLGNPNFAAAVMAIMGVLVFSSVFISDFKNSYRVSAVILALLLVFMIYRSNARQGLLSYAIGVGVFLIIWVWGKNRKIGVTSLLFAIVVFVYAVLGMLQVGQLEKYLYKPSVSVRGYYWRAGFEMFSSNPLFGVGIDRYGSYFKQYREVDYPLSVGFSLTSSNAHNTFIQFFATGGVFLGLAYLVLNAFVLYRAIIGIKNLVGIHKFYLTGAFSAWIAFHAQSLVSIDNIGISIWGWTLAGVIIGLSMQASSSEIENEIYFSRKNNKVNLNQTLISGVSIMLALILVALLYRGESISFKGTENVNLQDAASRSYFRDLQLNLINTPLNDPTYKLFAASRLIQGGFEEGLVEAEELYRRDPRNLDTLALLAFTYEQSGNLPKAIEYRIAITELDPWNAANFLALGRYYKSQGAKEQSELMLNKILSFAAMHPIAEEAKKEIGS
jgi:O-antigen ligase